MNSPRRKYGNKPVEIDGIRFASQKEGRRYTELKLLERAGEIDNLTLQPRYPLVVNGVKICTYVADFSYVDHRISDGVIEDVKGVQTPEFKLKAKLMLAVHGISVVLV